MAKRNRKKKKSINWKRILLITALVGIGVYLYHHNGDFAADVKNITNKIELPDSKEIKETISSTVAKAKELPQQLTKETPTKTKRATKQEIQHTADTDAILALEIPRSTVTHQEIILKKHGFTISYNNYLKCPNWVAWELTRGELQGEIPRESTFRPDPELPEPRVKHSDYSHSGYDRGHMAPAADMKWSEKAMQESFFTSNICPQNRNLNRGDWNDLEELCRAWGQKYGRVYIVCGPVFKSKVTKRLKKGNVSIPDQFFKVVLIYNRKDPKAMGFLFNNKSGSNDLDKYMVSVDYIEGITGLDFFHKIPDSIENKIEAIIPALPSK